MRLRQTSVSPIEYKHGMQDGHKVGSNETIMVEVIPMLQLHGLD